MATERNEIEARYKWDLSVIYPTLSDFYAKLSRNGCEIYQKKVGASFPLGTMLRICDKNGFYAIGEVIEYPDGAAIKLRERFDITK